MDFNKLLSTLDSLNKPKLTESVDTEVTECGMDTPTPPHSPPTMTVSLNANGLDDISSLMRLLVKVNPDMMPKDDKGPTLSADPNILTISNNHPEPLKMLPEPAELDGDEDGDLDNDEDENLIVPMAAAGLGKATSAGLNAVSAVQDKMKDIGTGIVNQLDGKEETEEDLDGGFQSASTSAKDTKTFDTDKLVGKSNGLDKEKDMVKHSYKQGDNPMAIKKSITDSIRHELQQRLADIKTR